MHDSDARKKSELFEKIREAIVLKIQKTFEKNADIATSIESGTKHTFTEPTMKTSSHATPAFAARQDRVFEIEYEAKLLRHMAKEEEFENNWVKAYALIFESYCSKGIQVALKELPIFETQIKNNPLGLLENVRKLMHTPERAKYPQLTLIEVLSNFLKLKQGDNESLLDYYSRFKLEKNVVENLLEEA